MNIKNNKRVHCMKYLMIKRFDPEISSNGHNYIAIMSKSKDGKYVTFNSVKKIIKERDNALKLIESLKQETEVLKEDLSRSKRIIEDSIKEEISPSVIMGW